MRNAAKCFVIEYLFRKNAISSSTKWNFQATPTKQAAHQTFSRFYVFYVFQVLKICPFYGFFMISQKNMSILCPNYRVISGKELSFGVINGIRSKVFYLKTLENHTDYPGLLGLHANRIPWLFQVFPDQKYQNSLTFSAENIRFIICGVQRTPVW